MKQFATYFTHGVRNGAKLRTEVYRSKTIPEILSSVESFFEAQLGAADILECAEVA